MTEGAPKLMDLSPFRATRFAEGRPWLDEYAYGDDRQLTVSR
jgi:sarcosine oxidase subunit beta